MSSKTRTEHRFVELPPPSLRATTITSTKIAAEGHCRMCLRSVRIRPLTRHHLVPEGWFRKQPVHLRAIRNAHANIAPLCRPCHDRVDANHEATRREARMHLRRSLSQQEIAFAIQVRGRAWLDEDYPPR